MARSTAGLTEQDLDELRRLLADGKRPRVQLSGPHFPVGAAGTVVRVGSPDTDGADFVRVRVKVNGMTDELAFAPGELSLRRPGSRASKATGSATKAGRSTARTARPATKAARPAAPAAPRPAERPAPAAIRDEPAKARNEPAKAGGEPAKATGRRRKAAPVKVSFTISSSGASWLLSATRGNKSLVRTASLPPGVVTAVSELLDQPALSESVSEINDAALSEARARAEQLRAELDRLEAVLATHRRP